MAEQFRWKPEDLAPTGRPPLILEPLRLALVTGTVVGLAGAAIPWAHGQTGLGVVAFKPLFENDGVLLVGAAILAVGLTLSRNAADSRTRTLQALLGVAGAVAVLAWLSAVQTRDALLHRRNELWSGDGDTGMVVAGAGIAVMAIAAFALTVDAWRRNGADPSPEDLRLTPRVMLRVVVEIAAGILGLVAGIVLTLNVGPYAIFLMVFAALIGGGAGLALGQRLARRI